MPGLPRNVENVRNHSAMPAVDPVDLGDGHRGGTVVAEQVLAHRRRLEHDGVGHALELGQAADHVDDVVEVAGHGVSDGRGHRSAE